MKIYIQDPKNAINAVLVYAAHMNPNLSEYLLDDWFIGYNEKEEKKTRFKIPFGESSFIYDNIVVKIKYMQKGEVVGCGIGPDFLSLVTLEADADLDFFGKLICAARDFYNSSKKKSEIITYIHNQGHWNSLSRLPKRALDTIYLPKDLLSKITDDVTHFLNNKKLYRSLCIPYKRNYLFEGIPGTGKTSLIYALASQFDKNIAIMNFNLDVDDATFMKAISRLPEKTILVLEDIDALFVERKPGDSNKSMISFSGLLNTLDGIAHKEEQLTFLTTNYITKLDKTLIRPGRIDKTLKFSYATIYQIELMFYKFFPDKSEEWKKFKKKIKGLKTTIATLQSFFFSHLNDDIVNYVEELKHMTNEACDFGENKRLYS